MHLAAPAQLSFAAHCHVFADEVLLSRDISKEAYAHFLQLAIFEFSVAVLVYNTYCIRINYCKRFAQSAGPWFGHRFAQSAGPRSPLRSVRCAMEICCISQPLCHHFALLCEFRTLFDTVFRSLGSLLEDMGNTFTI